MNWNYFGWFGLLGLASFLYYLAFPAQFDKAFFLLVLCGVVSSIVCPIVASIRSSKWWLSVSICGLVSMVGFFWHISA